MKTSSIVSPSNEPMVVIKKWQIEFCQDNHCAAALLQFFIYFHDIKRGIIEKNRRNNDFELKNGGHGEHDTSFLQFHTEEDLEEALMGLWKKDTIRKAIKFLQEIEAISIHKNPNPKYAFDNRRFFLLNTEKLNDYLIERKIAPSQTKNRPSETKNRPTISETTPESIYSFFNISLYPKLSNLNNPKTRTQAREEVLKDPYFADKIIFEDNTGAIIICLAPNLRFSMRSYEEIYNFTNEQEHALKSKIKAFVKEVAKHSEEAAEYVNTYMDVLKDIAWDFTTNLPEPDLNISPEDMKKYNLNPRRY